MKFAEPIWLYAGGGVCVGLILLFRMAGPRGDGCWNRSRRDICSMN